MTPEWTFADRLRKARRTARLRQSEIATVLGVTTAAVSQWEAGNAKPRDIVAVAQKLGELTDIEPEWFLGLRTGSRWMGSSDISDELAVPDSLADMPPDSRARARHPTAAARGVRGPAVVDDVGVPIPA